MRGWIRGWLGRTEELTVIVHFIDGAVEGHAVVKVAVSVRYYDGETGAPVQTESQLA